MSKHLPDFFERYYEQVDTALRHYLSGHTETKSRLGSAMRYSTLAGGKRIRPVLLLATAKALGANPDHALRYACAIELIHAYSLVHDDLPAMDDDALRRGQATCHIAFDEATAILAGDGLQTMAFEIAAQLSDNTDARAQLQIIQVLAQASGARGMVLGQAIDLASVGESPSLQDLEAMHRLKTGALIDASVRIGALCSGHANPEILSTLERYSRAIGLGFQVQDDILDVTADTETLGKEQGADQALNKPTYASLLGLEGARQKFASLHLEAKNALSELDECDTSELMAIADFLADRAS